MYREIGAFDAKARLSELLREVAERQRFTISVRGKPVADLVPSEANARQDIQATIDALRKIELIKGVGDDEIRDWIREGRQ
ncbi:type II toxin-antitoxin system Phd/YefM family antitoxin [Pseudoduganella sp.]|uniref:type II toxin-antitoxin system Phd/YefM family antitoxin n=1 Tax=Pseudoduganella sp. TaxID=1880898 RepID=UPI0035B1F4A2